MRNLKIHLITSDLKFEANKHIIQFQLSSYCVSWLWVAKKSKSLSNKFWNLPIDWWKFWRCSLCSKSVRTSFCLLICTWHRSSLSNLLINKTAGDCSAWKPFNILRNSFKGWTCAPIPVRCEILWLILDDFYHIVVL
jgi:hypothetical protein